MELPSECKVLEKDVGTWSAELVIQRAPGAEPARTSGRAVSRLIGHGRWLVTDFRTDAGDFEGHGVMGFDPVRGRYVYTWVDSMRAFLAVGEGTWDAARATMTIVTEATFAGRAMRWREETTSIDADTRVFRSFMRDEQDGSEREMMTATYRRSS